MRNFRTYGLCAVAATALLAAGCGGGSNTRPAAPAASGSSTPSTPAEEAPTTITGIDHTTGLAAAGSTTTPIEIPAGGSVTRGGVMFSCAGETACMVSLTITDDGDVSGTSTGGTVTATFIDPLANMNAANAASIAVIMNRDIGALAGVQDDLTSDDETTPGAYGATATGLKNGGMIGMSAALDGIGAPNMDALTVAGAFDPNVANSMMTAEDDGITDEMAGAVGLMGWNHNVLHSDWGDTKTPTRDGGFETVAVLYSNLEPPALVAFADAGTVIADETMRGWFTPATAVEINTTLSTEATPTANILFDVEGQDIAELERNIENTAVIRGSYFGANGRFTCSNGACRIVRATTTGDDGNPAPFRVGDTNDAEEGSQGGGTWTFTPDDGEMVMLPDQDWLAFGFWLTAPDDAANGLHRIGVFHDGMDMYAFSEGGDTAGQGLEGSATYDGSAAGYYVNGEESGLFTASAHLTADFGEDNANGTLSGRVDNFKNGMGAFIGTDTRADPNDPMAGGESDWVLTLRSSEISLGGGLGAAGTETNRQIGGSADGVQWIEGEWDAQFYGGGDRAATPEAPSGVGGTFRAITDELSTGGYKGVIGGFGAEMGTRTEPPAEDNGG